MKLVPISIARIRTRKPKTNIRALLDEFESMDVDAVIVDHDFEYDMQRIHFAAKVRYAIMKTNRNWRCFVNNKTVYLIRGL